MSKSRDYDYDQITIELTKKAPIPVNGPKPSIYDVYEMMGHNQGRIPRLPGQ
ncbi:TPA: hypothetical protein N0F65_011456 [Lagenidium giganteum]|uniref:Uncharacterized protein n=1 Tax=Lagenidium giganteum TaxID=4803 RepID=A0AAV2ZC64_9STRA|nr:TPA: hypothetical protein N0F65_011456 [Lagenidium giganteum]